MNSLQTSKLGSYRAVKALLQSTTETSDIAALPARLAAFITQVETIDALDLTQNQPIDGRIADRDRALAAAIGATLEIAGYAASHAADHGLHDLAAQVAVAPPDFERLRLTRRMGLAQQVHDAVVPIVADLAGHGVTAATLTALQAKIDAASAALSVPRTTIAAKKAATEEMAKAFAEADAQLEVHIDPLLFPLRNTSPQFYAAYRTARDVVASGGPTAERKPAPAATEAAKPAKENPAA